MTCYAVLTAAGAGTRLGSDLPKALVPLDGVPLVVHAARQLAATGLIDAIVVTAPAQHLAAMRAALGVSIPRPSSPVVTHPQPAPTVPASQQGSLPDAASASHIPVTVVVGGPSRQASVVAGLAALPEPRSRSAAPAETPRGARAHRAQPAGEPTVPGGASIVVVHDAARALAPADMIARVIASVRGGNVAVIPLLAVHDTMTRVAAGALTDGAGQEIVALGVVARSELAIVQTPQGFDRAVLERAHDAARARGVDGLDEATAATDDASLVEALGHPVHGVVGDERALKITTARDLAFARLLLAEQVSAPRVTSSLE